MDEKEQTSALENIERFDSWFQYAETIGQTRLYNFLMAFSILLAACSGLLTVRKAPADILSGSLALGGLTICIFSIALGLRQIKFHIMIEREIDRLLKKGQKEGFDVSLLPVHHVECLKKSFKRGAHNGQRLNRMQHYFSARRFLWIVPCVFAILFSLTLGVSVFMAKHDPSVSHLSAP